MKKNISPAVATIIIIVVVVIVAMIGWRSLGPRTDGPQQPVDMKKMMGSQQIAPPSTNRR